MFFDSRVPESMAALPGRRHSLADDKDELVIVLEKAGKRRNYTPEQRREARRASSRAYAAKNREARVEATRRWRAKVKQA
jgi:hypothetical protein